MKTVYRNLVNLTSTVVEHAQLVSNALQEHGNGLAQRIVVNVTALVAQVKQALTQTARRVLQDESISATEKVVSLFEPHTALLRKGMVSKPMEFGCEV